MNHSMNNSIEWVSYDQIYLFDLKPKLQALDLYIKENSAPFHIYEIAQILEMEPTKIESFMDKHEFASLDTSCLFSLLLHSESELSGYITRQWKYHDVTHYTPEIISEIYKLNLHKVQSAFNELDVAFVTNDQLIDIFKRIHVICFPKS